jgi:hypothetical protein
MADSVRVPGVRDVASRVEKFLEDNYGEAIDHPNVSEGLWLAMQLAGGPHQAAAVMRYCGLNFTEK